MTDADRALRRMEPAAPAALRRRTRSPRSPRVLFAGTAAAALATWRRASPRGRLFRETLLAAVAMSATAFGVCVLTNAPPDFSRVFYVAQALCDLLIAAAAAWLVQALAVSGRPRALVDSKRG